MMDYIENWFNVIFWVVVILSPGVMLGGLWRIYKWAIMRRQLRYDRRLRKSMLTVLHHHTRKGGASKLKS